MIRNQDNRLNLPEYLSLDGKYAVDCTAFSPEKVALRILPIGFSGGDGEAETAPHQPYRLTVTVEAWLKAADTEGIHFLPAERAVMEYVQRLRSNGHV